MVPSLVYEQQGPRARRHLVEFVIDSQPRRRQMTGIWLPSTARFRRQ